MQIIKAGIRSLTSRIPFLRTRSMTEKICKIAQPVSRSLFNHQKLIDQIQSPEVSIKDRIQTKWFKKSRNKMQKKISKCSNSISFTTVWSWTSQFLALMMTLRKVQKNLQKIFKQLLKSLSTGKVLQLAKLNLHQPIRQLRGKILLRLTRNVHHRE